MWKEFGNAIGDKIYMQAIKWAGIITDKYATIVHSKRTQAIIASLLLLTGESQSDTLGDISKKCIEDTSNWKMNI